MKDKSFFFFFAASNDIKDKMSSSNEVESLLDQNDDYYLELSQEPVKFEPVNDVTDVFFDDSKQQVI